MECPSLDLMVALIERLAEEEGVQVKVSLSDDESHPNAFLIRALEEIAMIDGNSCNGVRIEYSFSIEYGPAIQTLSTNFISALSEARSRISTAFDKKVK